MTAKGAKELAVTNASLGDMQNITDVANSLATVIMDKKLAVVVQQKNYVLVEGWQLAGAWFGIVPIIKSLERQYERIPGYDGSKPDDDEIKYRAEVELLNTKTNTIVGFGIAICSNKEKGKKDFQEFAVASMAQTRAVAKAYRLTLGWIIKLAGYEGTPAEEMEGSEDAPVVKASAEDKKSALEEAKAKMKGGTEDGSA